VRLTRGSPFGQGAGRAGRVVAALAKAASLGCALRLAASPASPLRTTDFTDSLD